MNNEENKPYRSGVIGQATAKFGGSIEIGIHGWKNKQLTPEKVAISLRELKKPLNAGDEIPDGAETYPPQIWLEFNNLTSINLMRDALDCLEQFLKTGNFPDDDTKRRNRTPTTPEPPSFEESMGEKKM